MYGPFSPGRVHTPAILHQHHLIHSGVREGNSWTIFTNGERMIFSGRNSPAFTEIVSSGHVHD